MKHYIVFEDYSEYNQFEGSYDWIVEEFKTLQQANKRVDELKHLQGSGYVRKIIGPLVKAEK